MAATINIHCPKCGAIVCCDYLKGWIHDFLFFKLLRTSFRLDCRCGCKKTYWFCSPNQLSKMFADQPSEGMEKINLSGRANTISDSVEFTEANDHNPEVARQCPRCGGTGHELLDPDTSCPKCAGTKKVTVRRFDNDAPIIEAHVNGAGWCKCPFCGIRFLITDKGRWTGLRHVRCGQKIKITPAA